MKKTLGTFMLTAVYVGCLATASSRLLAASDEAATVEAVVNHHIAAVIKKDVEGVLKDYADDAVMVLPSGTYAGKSELRAAFEKFLVPQAPIPASMSLASTKGDVALEDWVIKGPSGEIRGTDLFVVRHGKIVFQTLKPSMPAPASK